MASTSTSTSTSRTHRANPSVTGELSPNVWYFAQLGLVEVAYQLRRINHHLKVFAAIRKEAYARLPKTNGDGPAVPRQCCRYRLLAREPARDLRQQRPPGEERLHGAAGALARRSARGIPGTHSGHRHIHARRRGRFEYHLPAHAAPTARSDDHRRAPGRTPARRAAKRAPLEGGRAPGRHRNRPRISGRDRAAYRQPRAGTASASSPR